MVNELGTASSKAAPARPSSAMQMEGGDRRFTHGQHKGQTYEEVGSVRRTGGVAPLGLVAATREIYSIM